MRPTVSRLGLILFFSGFCSLVYQVAWLRLLRLIFGSSTASTAVVLAIFMGGLGLGGLVLGRRAERSPNPLRFYAFLELGIALSAALSPLLIDAVRGLYIALGGAEGLGLFGATALRLLLATIVLGVPTTLMGGTLPAVAQAMERDKDEGRRLVALFYGVNTFGAVTGAFLTTFILLELLGVRQSLWLSAALNLLLAMVVRAMAARTMADPHPLTPSPRKRGETGEEGSPTNLERVPGGEGSTASRLVLFGAFFVGFVFFLMEIVWYRMLAPILGGSSYTFGLILAVALFGIAVGGGLYSLGSEGRRPSLEALAWTAVLEAFALIVPYALGDHLALFTAIVRRLGAEGFTGMVLGWTIVTVIVILPAAVIAGYQFPLLVGLLGSGREKVGSQVGLAYAWNTFGAILGSLAGGFGLLPLLGALRLWLLSTLGLVLLGVAMAWTALGTRRPARLLAPILAGALALALGLADGPTAFWRHVPIGAGRLDVGFDGPNDVRHKMHQERRSLVLEEEGIESSVALMRRNELALYVNGKSDGSVRTDAPTMVWSGLVGALLHPDPKNVLAIGLGSGTTAGWLAAVPGVERVDVVELEPTVIELARYFEPVNAFVMDRDNVRVWAGDGREHVLTTSERYDLVMSQPSNPYRAGVADLFSQDFYASLAERLAPGGIFMQWLQGYEVDPSVVRTAYATLGSVFPHVESWQINATDLLLLATREPLVHDLDRIRRRIGGEPYARALDVTWRVGGIEGLYSGFIGNDRLTRVLAEGVAPSTDDRPRIELGFARSVGRKGLFRLEELQEIARRVGADRPFSSVGAPLDGERLREARAVRQAIDVFTESPAAVPDPAEAHRREARRRWTGDDLSGALAAWHKQPAAPEWLADRLLVAESLAEAGDPAAAAAIASIALRLPTEAEFLSARDLLRRGDAAASAEHLEGAFRLLRADGWAYEPAVRRGFALIDDILAQHPAAGPALLDALAEPFAVMLFEEARLITRVNLAARVDFAGHCVEAFEDLEPHVPWEERFLAARLRCYETTDHPLADRARTELEEFLAEAPAGLLGG